MPASLKIVLLTTAKAQDAEGKFPIALQYTLHRKVSRLRLGKSVLPDQWKGVPPEYVQLRGLHKHPNARLLNLYLSKELTRAERIVLEAESEDRDLAFAEFKRKFKNLQVTDFFQWHDQFIKYRQKIGELKAVTVKKYAVQRNKLKKFRSSVRLNEITPIFISNYNLFLMEKLGNAHNTRHKALVYLKSIYDYAKKKGAISGDPFMDINMTAKYGPRTFLTTEEVDDLISLYRSQALKDTLQEVLRKFLWSCFTGQGFGDMIEARYTDIIEIAGHRCLTNQRIKTDKPYFVPLLPIALELITPFPDSPDELIFKPISNQKYNTIIKEVARMVGIRKKLSSHVARHTCGHLFVARGVSRDYIMQILGHSRLNTTQHYSQIMPEHVIREIKDKF